MGDLLKGGLMQAAVSMRGHVESGLECAGHTVPVAVPRSEARRDLRCALSSGTGSSVGASFPQSKSCVTSLRTPWDRGGLWALVILEAPPWVILGVLHCVHTQFKHFLNCKS